MKTSRARRTNRAFRANDFSALNPSLWANEAIVQLQPRMIIGNLIHRDFDSKVARFGDLVNAWVPSTFTMKRKGALLEAVQDQNASGTVIQVPCDQWPHVSFVIADGEEDRSFIDLVENLLTPAVNALAAGIDALTSARILQFLTNYAGHLGGISSDTVYDYMLDTKAVMDANSAPDDGRVMLMSSATEIAGLKSSLFVEASKRGDGGSALENAILGKVANFQTYRAASTPSVKSGQVAVSTTTTANTIVGATVVPVTSATGLAAGMWLTVAGDDVPHQISAVNSLNLTVTPALSRATTSGAAVIALTPGQVNLSGGYKGTSSSPRVIGYAKEIAIDTTTVAPKIGQFVTFNTSTTKYVIIGVSTISAGTQYGITLDRPLEADIADNDKVNFGPTGEYNFGFLRNAFSLVNRPLPQPRPITGLTSRVITDPRGRLSLRVTISYDPVTQGHRVVIDTLCGTGTLDTNLGAVMFG